LARQTINLTATADQLEVLTAFLREIWNKIGLPGDALFSFELALEELFVNATTHGAEAGGRAPKVFVAVSHGSETVEAVFEDDAPAFNPLTQAEPILDAPLEERPIGGLGVYLVKNVMDTVDYEYVTGRNRISMSKRI
jgi:serine/threonine-protein kinase RsbW